MPGAIVVDRLAVDVLHHQVGLAQRRGAAVEQAGDVGMFQLGQNPAFDQKALDQLRTQPGRTHQLHGRALLELAVNALGEIDHAHAAFAEPACQPVRADVLAEVLVLVPASILRNRSGSAEETGRAPVGVDQQLDFVAQCPVAGADLVVEAMTENQALKNETFAALAVSVMLFAGCQGVIGAALDRLRHPAAPTIGAMGYLVVGITLAINVLVVWVERREGRRLQSELLASDAAHTASDVAASLLVLGSFLAARAGIAWADVAVALVGDHSHFTGRHASFAYRWFMDPTSRAIYPEDDHDAQSQAFVADLRAGAARRDSKDTETRSMIAELQEGSPEFAELWDQHEVAFRRRGSKRINHPELGLIDVNCLNLFSEDGRQRLLWFTPTPGTDSAELLDLLAVIGTQALSEPS